MSARKALFSSMCAALFAAATSASAQVQTAGTVYIDLDATGASAGAVTGPVAHGGSLGTGFEVFGDPQYGMTGGVMGIQFDGDGDALALDAVSPADINGTESWSIEVWGYNTGGFGAEETMVNLWHRAGDGSGSFFWGGEFRWGAFGAWSNDMGYEYGAPTQGGWHHIVLTNEGGIGNTISVYVDGQLDNSREMAVALREGAEASRPVIGWNVNAAGATATPNDGQPFSGTIARVRVHGDELSAAQVLNNYETEKADFGISDPGPTPTPWPGGTLAVKGELLIDLDATAMAVGAVPATIPNGGSLGTNFESIGDPQVAAIGGLNAFEFDGDDYLGLDAISPASINGVEDWTIEVWAFNPDVAFEETMVNLWHRGGNGSGSFNFSTAPVWGAFGAWANDFGYDPAPTGGSWHHLVVTNGPGIGSKMQVYVDGQINNGRNQVVALREGADASRPMIGGNVTGTTVDAAPGDGVSYSGSLARVRVHTEALTAAEIKHNFDEERVEFGFAPAAASNAADPLTFNDANPVDGPDFATQEVITITNDGLGDLSFVDQGGEPNQGLIITGSSLFSITSVSGDLTQPLEPGQSVDVVVEFAPQSSDYSSDGTGNTKNATLSVYTNDASSPLVINMEATAVPVELSTFEIQ